MDLSQFKQKFIDEANTLLVNLDNALLELEKDPSSKQYIDESFRVMHTIKGASGMYGFEKVMEVTHELESLYDIVRENKLEAPQTLIEVTFEAADHIRALLVDEEFANLENIQRHGALRTNIEVIKLKLNFPKNKSELTQHDRPDTKNTTSTATWNILFYPSDELIRRAVNIAYTFQDLFQLGEYKINNKPFHSNEQQYWSIFLVTDKHYDEIEGALMFIMDYCKITKIADFNIFDPSGFENRDKKVYETTTFPVEPSANQEYTINNADQTIEHPLEFQKGKNPEETSHLLSAADVSECNANVRQNLISSSEVSTQVFSKQKTSHINVDSSKLDRLMYLVSELVTSKSELLISLQKQNLEKANETAEKIEKLSKYFSENAMSIRLVSLHEMLNRFKRLIRDLSKQLGKSVNFVTHGEDTELDKNIIDNLAEPIMHIIRNCIDHGIETPESRIKSGKPEQGAIGLTAYISGNYVFICISDDGTGIDIDKVKQKAIDKGILKPTDNPTNKEIYDLIFLPGFSTAQSLTSVSGRGVGMDIVKKRITDLRGEVMVSSDWGIGTTFTLKIQQSLSIIDTLLFTVDDSYFTIPISEIEVCLQLSNKMINERRNTSTIEFNSNLIPFVDLRYLFKMSTSTSEMTKAIIIKNENKELALLTDRIIGEHQAVLKPLGKSLQGQMYITSASQLGDGNIAFMIDTNSLLKQNSY